MKTRLLPCLGGAALACAALLAMGATQEHPLDLASLMRQGDAAFAQGDFAAAADLFQRAVEVSDDPSPAAYNQALATYRLALLNPEPSAAGLREAAALFRCCLTPGDPRRPRALYGLANCLLHGPAGPDGANLRQAIERYRQCLQEAPAGSDLARDAAQNLNLARLRASQFEPPSQPQDDPGSDKNTGGRPDRLPVQGPDDGNTEPGDPTKEPGDGTSEDKGTAPKREPGSKSGPAGDPTRPEGSPDGPAPRSATEAVAGLERAVRDILRDRRTNLLKSQPPVPEEVEDY